MQVTAQDFHKGTLTNFLLQSEHARGWLAKEWQRLLDEGYVEIAPGVLRHPETGTEVEG